MADVSACILVGVGMGGGGMISGHWFFATCSLPLTVEIFGHWCICCVAVEWELR